MDTFTIDTLNNTNSCGFVLVNRFLGLAIFVFSEIRWSYAQSEVIFLVVGHVCLKTLSNI